MGGFQAGGQLGQLGGAGKPGGGLGGLGGTAGGVGGKPGGTVQGGQQTVDPASTGLMQGGNPAWSPQTGGPPVNPVPDWYGGSQQYRGVNHPDPLIGVGRVQRGPQTFRTLGMQPTSGTPQATPPPGASGGPPDQTTS